MTDQQPPGPPDWVVVERLMGGEHVPQASRAEQHEAIRRLNKNGYGPGTIGHLLGRPETSISRLISTWKNRQPAQ